MAYIREIITDGHPTLRKVAKKVDPAEIADPLFQQLLDDMWETMYEAPGIGLAAPQVGVSKRIFVVDMQDDRHPEWAPLIAINPKFTRREGEHTALEGCLSVPDLHWSIVRPNEVHLVGYNLEGNEISIEADEYLGRVLQHELDHLDGKLFVDRLPFEERLKVLDVIKGVKTTWS